MHRLQGVIHRHQPLTVLLLLALTLACQHPDPSPDRGMPATVPPTAPSIEALPPALTPTPTLAPAPTTILIHTSAPAPDRPVAEHRDPSTGARAYTQLLEMIPNTPQTRSYVMINDYALNRQVLGIPPPTTGEHDPAAVKAYLKTLQETWDPMDGTQGYPTLTEGAWISGDHSTWKKYDAFEHLGFDIRDVAQSVVAGQYQHSLEIITGIFDPDQAEALLRECSECPVPTINQNGEQSFYTWGEEAGGSLARRWAPPIFDHLGRGGSIAISRDSVFRALYTADMDAMLDAEQGEIASLRDMPDFRQIAEIADEAGAYGLLISNDVERFNYTRWMDTQAEIRGTITPESKKSEAHETTIKATNRSSLLRPYTAVGWAAGVDDMGRFMIIALAHDNLEATTHNEAALQSRLFKGGWLWNRSVMDVESWHEALGAVGVDTRTEGTTVVMQMWGDISGSNWRSMLTVDAPLLLYE